MRISDWSSDVCSADLGTDIAAPRRLRRAEDGERAVVGDDRPVDQIDETHPRLLEIGLTIGECRNRVEPIAGPREGSSTVEIIIGTASNPEVGRDRHDVVEGKRVDVRVVWGRAG